MKFNIPETVLSAVRERDVRPGNVYSAKGGKNTAFWVVVAVNEKNVTALGINTQGEITSATTYYRSVFEGDGRYREARPILGFVEGIEDLTFDVQWGAA